MITPEEFMHVVHRLGPQATEDIEWAEGLDLPVSAEEFALEAIFVICNSGMKNTVARGIFDRCCDALFQARPVIDVFKHAGKVSAIEHIWRARVELFAELKHRAARGPEELLAFCGALPWIGDITKFHLAKNFGADLAKPDVHLQRLAEREDCTAQALCERLAEATGWRVATVDTLLWRACANGIIDSRTGAIEGLSA